MILWREFWYEIINKMMLSASTVHGSFILSFNLGHVAKVSRRFTEGLY